MSEQPKATFLASIVNTIRRSADSVSEGADAVKYLITDGGALEEVPIFSTAVKLLNVKDIFVQQRLQRNCQAFLHAVEGADLKNIEVLRHRLESDPEYMSDFVDTIISVMMEGQKPLKAELIGRLVIALSNGSISFDEFQSISQIVQVAATPALVALKGFLDRKAGVTHQSGGGAVPEEPLIMSIGLAYRSGTMFRVSDLGVKLYQFGFGVSVVP